MPATNRLETSTEEQGGAGRAWRQGQAELPPRGPPPWPNHLPGFATHPSLSQMLGRMVTILALGWLTGMTFAASKPPVFAAPPERKASVLRPGLNHGPTVSLAELRERAALFTNRLTLPEFETTPAAIQSSLESGMAGCNAALDRIASLPPSAATFSNTFAAADDVLLTANGLANRLSLIKETNPDSNLRSAATEALKKLQEWAVSLEYREDVYQVLKGVASASPKLDPESDKLVAETLRDYHRAGLDLPKAERDQIEVLRKRLAVRGTDFERNINEAHATVTFTRAQLAGVSDALLAQGPVKTAPDTYTLHANITWQYLAVMENCRNENTRRQMETARASLAMDTNPAVLEDILRLRCEIARRLGYRSWADYQIQVKMIRTAATAVEFLERLESGLQPKFDAELAEMRARKIRDTHNEAATIESWDWRYYAGQVRKERFNVDAEALRAYFPMQRVVDGMFNIYQRVFGVIFIPVTPPYAWVDDLQLFCVSDANTREPLGFFYLDLFPRDGKFNHFAVFPIVEGKRLADGSYQRPVVALICNFPPPTPDAPALLAHADVETLFHEFGHVMHNLLTRANYCRFSGANVPRDFVEAPSQMLEAWVWDQKVLDSFARHYERPEKKIPAKMLNQLKEARLATSGCFYRRQVAFGLMDLALHTQITEQGVTNALRLSDAILAQAFLPAPPGTAFPCYFGHLVGYDAGYYGYAWAKAIASDLATVFEEAPDRWLDATAGRRLRNEIYAVGDSRDVSESVAAFLGRDQSLEPFLREIGVTNFEPPAKADPAAPPRAGTPLRPFLPQR